MNLASIKGGGQTGGRHCLLNICLLLLLVPFPAMAQSIDYGELEKLFAEPITTSVTGSPQRASDVPATMEIITAEEIRRSGARTIPEVLAHIDGVDTLRYTQDQVEVGLRGYDQAYSPRLLVLIDGRQVYADFYGLTLWSHLALELAAVRQIEVVKGPSSALFGFNAVDGVINIITFNPLYDDVQQLSVSAGTQNLVEASTVWTFKPRPGMGLRLTLGGRTDSQFSTPIPAVQANTNLDGNQRGEAALNGVFEVGKSSQMAFEATVSALKESDVDPTYYRLYNHARIASLKGGLFSDSSFGLIQATAYSNWIIDDTALQILGSPSHFSNRLVVGQLQDIVRAGNAHTLRVAMEYRHSTEVSTPVNGAIVGYEILSTGGMWEWRIDPDWTMTHALRIDHLMLSRSGQTPQNYPLTNSDWNRNSDELSFNSGLVWHVDNRNVVRLTAGRGVQVPNLVDAGAALVDAPEVKITGVPYLEPMRVNNYELAWDRSLTRIDALLRTSVFHLDSNNMLANLASYIPAADGVYYTPGNIGDSHANGIELGLRSRTRGFATAGWRWDLSYRYEKITDDLIPSAQNGQAAVDFEHVAPKHLAKINLGWTHGRIEIDGYLRYLSDTAGLLPQTGQFTTTLVPIADYATLDARVAYRIAPGWHLWLSGQNLLQAQQQQTGAAEVQRSVIGGLSIDY